MALREWVVQLETTRPPDEYDDLDQKLLAAVKRALPRAHLYGTAVAAKNVYVEIGAEITKPTA